ncbi:MAG: B12-binding domain-containing radical SAM protein [Oligoflexia bacterium]|nr:B12-binding domain-containing radical SAM protein [Oligoflexia bacterium]
MNKIIIKRILLIHSSHYYEDQCKGQYEGQCKGQKKVVRAKSLLDRLTVTHVVHSALPLLAAYTPERIDVEIVEDALEDINFDDSADIVGISAQVMQIDRAIDIADEFKRRGKIVLMGGFLPTMHPQKVVDHVDAICIGPADRVWTQMLEDIENGTLKKIYQDKDGSRFDLKIMPVPRFDLIKRDRFTLYPIHATRGCPFKCEYCSIIQFHQGSYLLRPIEDVIRDIKATKSKWIYFCDDNLMENVEYCKKLFKQMIPLNVVWGTQTSINCANDPELLELAHLSGCRYVAVGMESISQKNLSNMNKNFTVVNKIHQQIENIHRSGIAAHVLIIFGLDEDTAETFDLTFKYLMESKIAIAEFFICTPYPATPFGQKMLAENRIINFDLSKYREGYVVFKHPTMSEEEILKNYWKMLRKFYSIKNIIKRIWGAPYKNHLYHFINAISYWAKIKRDIIPVYFGKGNKRVES